MFLLEKAAAVFNATGKIFILISGSSQFASDSSSNFFKIVTNMAVAKLSPAPIVSTGIT